MLLDIWMPDTDGITLLKEWAANGQLTMPVVMMSGHGTIETAVEATRIGAIDFLEKPIALQKLLATVKRALRSESAQSQAGLTLLSLGRSAIMAELRKRLAQIATLSVPVLLRGEAGVMPELFARYLHQPNTPWIVAGTALNNAPHELLAQTAGGLIFVEELAALTRSHQKNLAALLGKTGENQTRVVCFTVEEPARLAAELGFDAALLARLSELTLMLPALREHAEDIPDIAGILLAQLVEARVCPPRHFSTAALNALRQFHWPNNLQDLQGAVKKPGAYRAGGGNRRCRRRSGSRAVPSTSRRPGRLAARAAAARGAGSVRARLLRAIARAGSRLDRSRRREKRAGTHPSVPQAQGTGHYDGQEGRMNGHFGSAGIASDLGAMRCAIAAISNAPRLGSAARKKA